MSTIEQSVEKSFKVTKSTIECYKLRTEKGFYWADISLDIGDKAGRIQIASDFGDWQYYWGSCGSSFKNFLTQLDKGYVAGKFRADKYFDYDATVLSWKRKVIKSRKQEDISAETARKIWDEFENLEDMNGSADAFSVMAREQNNLMSFFDYCPDIQYDYTPGFNGFWKKVWPVFIETLKAEAQ